MSAADFVLISQGEHIILRAVSDDARDWLREHLDEIEADARLDARHALQVAEAISAGDLTIA